MKDQYANYVVQKVLEVCSEAQREAMLSRVRAQLHALKCLPYAKHIVGRVEKLLSTGTRYQTHARGRLLPDDEALAAHRQAAMAISDGLPLEDPVSMRAQAQARTSGGSPLHAGGQAQPGGGGGDERERERDPGSGGGGVAPPPDGPASDGLPLEDPVTRPSTGGAMALLPAPAAPAPGAGAGDAAPPQ